jgi:hypothetical protein
LKFKDKSIGREFKIILSGKHFENCIPEGISNLWDKNVGNNVIQIETPNILLKIT